ncbi:MAG: universal stress protein [Candidatus Rokubacteria bacterium]|nr:universal stress protein [Candidatus Rokubacteria bacterium]
MNVGKILVPLDGSALAEAALSRAVDIVRDCPTASLLLLRAAEAPVLAGGDPVEAQVEVVREAEEYLEQVAARARAEGAPEVSTSVWYGPPAPAIVEAAEIAKADMIVMSTHGRSGLGRLFLGSVAESVLRATHTPILLLRPAGAPVAPAHRGADREKEVAGV